jgi:hypothetical protein
MSDTDPVLATYNDIRQQVILRASVSEEGTLREEVFTRWAMDLLEEKGEIAGGEPCSCVATRVGKVSGYWLDRDMGRLTVFVSMFAGVSDPQRMPAADAAALIRGALRFVSKCRMNWHRALEESSEGFAFGEMISAIDFSSTATTVIVLTDHRCPKAPALKEKIDGRDVAWAVWDLERFHRLLTSGREREKITIDFAEVGEGPISFIKMPFPNTVYDTYLTMIPGDLLAEIYREHGARLLEQNVRTFLQARGKVNRGIRDTILNQPEMFLAYNNGLCATAAHIEIESEKGPVANIRSITDFQIVNGGQTTASLTSALLKDDADLSAVLVQLKLSVIKDPERVGAIVSNISRFANSQNKVNEADLLANDAFHVKVEHLSRAVWAPCRAGANRETKWFYERARGQFSDEKGRRRASASKLKTFEAEYPSNQWFTKTDLAKFENTWGGLPHMVSRGAQKNFAEFTIRLEKGFVPDIGYFHELVAKAILFRAAEKIVSGQEFGGYRANIVTYTLAWIAHHSGGGIDLRKIWAQQSIDQQMADLITAVCPAVHKLIVNSDGVNVTEWCKQERCWSRIKSGDLGLSAYWKRVLQQWRDSKVPTNGDGNGEVIDRIVSLGGDLWLSLARWARETRGLEDSQRSVASTLARTINSSRRPSARQANEGEAALVAARKKGFKMPVPHPV